MNWIFVVLGILQLVSIIIFVYWTLRIRKHDVNLQKRKKSIIVQPNGMESQSTQKEIVNNIVIDVEPILELQRQAAKENAQTVIAALDLFKEFLSNLQINVTVDIPNAPEAKVTTKVTYLKGLNKQYESIPDVP